MRLRDLFSATAAAAAFAAAFAVAPAAALADGAYATDDTDVNLSAPASNFGAAPGVNVRYLGPTGIRRGFVRFELSQVPAGVALERATLRMFVSALTAPGAVDFHVVTSAWAEDTVTAATQPSVGSSFASITFSAADVGSFIPLDVTSQVAAWLGGSPNHGLALYPSTIDDVHVTFAGKEAAAAGHPMELELVFAGPEGPAGQSVAGFSVPFGDPNCPEGGSGFVSATGTTYACNGETGPQGPQGPQGIMGPMGMTGAEGPQGPAGIPGPQGVQGPQGVDGAAGPQGPAGADGADGAPGPQGPAGMDGAQGAQGPAGPQGPQGVAGVAGPIGPQGPAGADGAQGPAGAQGPQGVAGPTGPTGPAGATGPEGPQGPQGFGGPPGPAGSTGATWLAEQTMRVPTLRWHQFEVNGPSMDIQFFYPLPEGLAFDGHSVWLADGYGILQKFRASDGTDEGLFIVGPFPGYIRDIVFDGEFIWVVGDNVENTTAASSARKVRIHDGVVVDEVMGLAGERFYSAAWDGRSLWISSSSRLLEVRTADATILRAINRGALREMRSDGEFIYGLTEVAFPGNNAITKIRASDLTVQATTPLGMSARAITLAGGSVWVGGGTSNLLRIVAADLTISHTIAMSNTSIGFDGANVLVSSGSTLHRLRARDGTNLGGTALSSSATLGKMVHDGVNAWVMISGFGTGAVAKRAF